MTEKYEGEEWTGWEEDRQDCVDGLIYELLNELDSSGSGLEWDIEEIAEVRDVIESILVDKLNLMTSYDFYPYRLLVPEE